MKKIASLLMALALVFTMAACGDSKDGDKDFTLDQKKLAEELLSEISFEDELSEVDAAMLYTGLDASAVAESLTYSGTGGTPEEIAVFKAASADKVDGLKKMIESRNEELQISYAGYGPEQVPKLKDAVLETKGLYVVYCVGPDASAAKEIINSYLK